ncbi:UDP diphosphate synthase [Candidatus Acidianus copahuensis]|uniref:Tritrans,polycis-undecaprenyl-diphosphate synthase (geranylgeranyl-diphosphate specific) n=1 Tax=Candidatus Acidianus copahuensis TaxID=1160895 RepID=A0A031LPN2_9CREN|nr:polyprenyl diphosphate synthase [Candidatus Acidianus copahuensis]EZQ04748.1 UDP diphosphate synthase [Candidatus Acidianus copahuensis]
MQRKLMTPLYFFYEKILWNQIKNGPMPNHVGIIPDGNRRWAKSNNSSVSEAYLQGYKKLKEVLIWLAELGVKNVTVFALSTENCDKRTKYELEAILNYIKKGIDDLLNEEYVYKYQVKVRTIGKVEKLSDGLRLSISNVVEKTSSFNKRRLTLAICYGGRQEILDAVSKLMDDYKKGSVKNLVLDEEVLKKYFYDSELEDIDLVIRTSGEMRISNFLLWHLAYSELFFCEVYWPEFRKIDLWRAIRSYQRRKRNYGA